MPGWNKGIWTGASSWLAAAHVCHTRQAHTVFRAEIKKVNLLLSPSRCSLVSSYHCLQSNFNKTTSVSPVHVAKPCRLSACIPEPPAHCDKVLQPSLMPSCSSSTPPLMFLPPRIRLNTPLSHLFPWLGIELHPLCWPANACSPSPRPLVLCARRGVLFLLLLRVPFCRHA